MNDVIEKTYSCHNHTRYYNKIVEDIFHDFWFRTINTFQKKVREQNVAPEDLFQDFWLTVHKESKEKMRSKLSKEMLILRKRELWRKHISLVPIVPFAVLMFIQLATLFSHAVLLIVISYTLQHTIMPLELVSLICVIYLIYNNRKVRKKEEELTDLETQDLQNENINKNSEKIGNIQNYLNYIEAITTTIVIISDIVDMVLVQEYGIIGEQKIAIDQLAFLLYNVVSVGLNCTSFYIENKKIGSANVCSQDKVASGLMLTSSCILLMRRVILMTLVLSLNAHTATTIGTIVGPVMGLIGIGCSLAGHVLAISSCKSQLQGLEISCKGIERGTISNTISESGLPAEEIYMGVR